MTLEETMTELGHTGRRVDIFKMDCEGCEWRMYEDLLEVDLRQILIQVHAYVHNTTSHFFQTLHDAGYVIFHKEPNILSGPGNCVEFSFLKLARPYFLVSEKAD
mmetsp:Transcript_17292/g.40121  ORF Transcript_17292/g.40121 Transcript_17292/m.40121 type:complete len:104 (-) Transcript_17292:1840-2151(-)